jgi:ATP-dependent protease HslVU (ClpYQ) peptidase subunit
MTCIIGMVDKKNDCVWIGGDSLGSNGFTKEVQQQPKIFKHEVFKNVIMGGTTTFRHLDILRYDETLFNEVDFYKKTELDHKYMVTKFIPNIMKAFKDGVLDTEEKNRGGNFIIGAGNKLFEIQEDYSVLEPKSGFVSVGCGEYAAHASLFTTENTDLTIPERIQLALCAAEFCCCGVQRPFKIINTKDEAEIVIS